MHRLPFPFLRMLLWAVCFVPLACGPLASETIRIATYNASLSRSAPGLLLKDLMRPSHDQIDAVIEIIQRTAPDILLINEFDYDLIGEARDAFVGRLATGPRGLSLDQSFFAPVNTGEPSGHDLDGDGKLNGPADAFGYGRFPGQYGMLLLSRFPIKAATARSFRLLKWEDLSWADLPVTDTDAAFPGAEARAAMRLSSKSHWDVQIDLGETLVTVLAAHPTPPVFDGPEDLNGRRNHDEIELLRRYINGAEFPSDTGEMAAMRPGPFVILGDLNADPMDGDGRTQAIRALLDDPRLRDPMPTSIGAVAASAAQAGANTGHRGDPASDTADWRDDQGPGNLRVDFVLPSRDLPVVGAGVFWPSPEDPLYRLIGAGKPVSSDHRLVWVDVDMP